MKKATLIFLLLTGGIASKAQTQLRGQARIDSLLAILPKASDDTIKVNLLVDLSFTYYSINPDEGIRYGNEALSLAEHLQWERGIANAHSRLGVNYSFGKSDHPHALEHYLAALKLNEKLGDKKGIAGCLNNIGTIYDDQNDDKKALDYYAQAMKINEEMGNMPWLANNLSNTGIIYTEMQEYAKAESYISRAAKIKEDLGDFHGQAINLSQLGHIYGAQKQYGKALDFLFRSLSIYRESGDIDGMAKCYDFISNAYKYISSDTSVDAKTQLTRIFSGNKLKALQASAAYSDSSIAFYTQTGNLLQLYSAYMQFSEVQALLGNDKVALQSHKQYTLLKDSVFNMEKDKKLTQSAMQYEFDKKDAATKAEQEKKDIRQQNIRNSISAGLAGALIFLVVVYRQRNKISLARKRSDDLLLNILPAEVAEELKSKGSADAKQFDEVTVMFTDFKGFTQISESLSPAELVYEIHQCFKAFDAIISKHNIEKIKTIGDSYMCAGGLPVANKTHASDVVNAALEIQKYMEEHLKASPFGRFGGARIGIHTGNVVAGIVGVKKFAYDIWGDTVNIASRMESSGEAGKINISGSTYELIKNPTAGQSDKFKFIHRGKIQAKNKGEIDMYFVESI